MLTKIEAEDLYSSIIKEQKEIMKSILNHAKMGMEDSKFQLFKKICFNGFGKSGLETSTNEHIKKYIGD